MRRRGVALAESLEILRWGLSGHPLDVSQTQVSSLAAVPDYRDKIDAASLAAGNARVIRGKRPA